MLPQHTLLDVQVHSVSLAAADVLAFELRHLDNQELPAFDAGAHIALQLPGGLLRHYSLLNAPGERQHYLIAVHRDPASRGGSIYLHETLRVGDRLKIGAPRNNFRLDEGRHRTVLVAGGIGITPLLAMIERLEQLGREWILHYATRTRRHAAFLDLLQRWEARGPGRVHLHFDDEQQGLLDLDSAVRTGGRDAHFYCCGPSPMLAAFERATDALPPHQVHVEYFKAKAVAPSQEGSPLAEAASFTVELCRSGMTLHVPAGRSILDVALDAGADVPYSCGEGFCGTCAARVIEGAPDHRDSVLDAAERQKGYVMMICCSRSLGGGRLVLDL
ncbi:PDR/VanB family oxidoreductase [Cupriavidus sp. 8B]